MERGAAGQRLVAPRSTPGASPGLASHLRFAPFTRRRSRRPGRPLQRAPRAPDGRTSKPCVFAARPHPGCHVQSGRLPRGKMVRGDRTRGRRRGHRPGRETGQGLSSASRHGPREPPRRPRATLRPLRRPGRPPGARSRAPAAAWCGPSPCGPPPRGCMQHEPLPGALPSGPHPRPCHRWAPWLFPCPLLSWDGCPGLTVQCRGGTRWAFAHSPMGESTVRHAHPANERTNERTSARETDSGLVFLSPCHPDRSGPQSPL